LIVMKWAAAAIAAARSLLWSHDTCLVAVDPAGPSSGRRFGALPSASSNRSHCGIVEPVNQ
jgi:hypothetical protein